MSKHGTLVPIKCTVISGLKSRAPITININLSFEYSHFGVRVHGIIVKQGLENKRTACGGEPHAVEVNGTSGGA